MSMIGLSIFQRYQKWFLVLVVATFIASALEVINVGLVLPVINVLFGSSEAAGQTVSYGKIVDYLTGLVRLVPSSNPLFVMCVFFLVAAVLKAFAKITQDMVRARLSNMINANCAKDMYNKNLSQDISFFINHKAGELSFRAIGLPNEVASYFMLLPLMLVELVNVIFISVLLLSVSPKLFGALALLAALYGVYIRFISKKVLDRIGREIPDIRSWQNVVVHETVGGIRDILTHGRQAVWMKRFGKYWDRFYRVKMTASWVRAISNNFLEMFIICGIAVAGIYASLRFTSAEILTFLPLLAIYILALMRIIPSFSNVCQYWMQMSTYWPSVTLYERLMDEQDKVMPGGVEPFGGWSKEIVFDKVGFEYVSHKAVLEGLSLTIPKNKVVALVGSSGAGKSTIIDLLLQFYRPQQGAIYVDGKDLSSLRVADWRRHIGVVSQNAFVFNASVKENIAFDERGVDMGKVIDAAKAAGAHEFISGLKDGYDAVVGDRGYTLSGGQRQRLCIARALYRDADILIFDEATSALDQQTEKQITDTIRSLAHQKTIIILAHRLTTIQNADVIYVLKGGRVEQAGTHEELSNQQGEYVRLYRAG